MPSLGSDMESGTLVEWRVKAGDTVARGTIVGLIETQKATMELESFVDGRIDALLVEPGTQVAVGTPLAHVVSADARPAPSAPAPVPATDLAPATTSETVPRTRSSPAARKRARELAIDLRTITPSGPHGAIVLRDVERMARPAAPRPMPATAGSMREAIGAAMARSKREIPHYYLQHQISVESALSSLAALNATRPIADRILPAAVWLHAVTRALWEVPELNGFFIDGHYRASEAVHLGTAIALRTGGVVAPAIPDADQKSLDELMAALRDLVARARSGRLRTSALTDATITVTSLGDRGCDAVWGVINPPQVAIVGVGSVVERPWSSGGQVRSHRVVTVTLSADHRVTDGHRGARFLAALDRFLQEPIVP